MRRALLLTSKSIAFGVVEHCFGTLKAMQLEAHSNAVEGSRHCSGALKAMLLEAQSIALAFAQHSCVTKDTHLLNSVNDEVFIFLNDTNLMRAFDSHVIEGI